MNRPAAPAAVILTACLAALLLAPTGLAGPSPSRAAPREDARPAAVGGGCQRLAGILALRTASGKRTAPFLPGSNLASTPLCHDFTGDGRMDVAFGILGGGSGGAFEWAVFRRTASNAGSVARRWRRVAERHSGGHTLLSRRGRLVVVRNPVYRRDDPNCCPTGGEIRRLYRVGAHRVKLVAKRRVRG